jgi:hypothetical protein
LTTLRKENGQFTEGWADTSELLLKTLVPPDSYDGETEEHARVRNETGLFLEDTEVDDRETEEIGDQLVRFSQEEVSKAVMRMGKDKAPGYDGITARVLRVALPTILEMVTDLFNESWEKAEFPRGWKRAVVVPLLKAQDKDRSNPKSYRPISLLPVLSKALEYLICQRLREQIGPRMSPNQYGYREKRSTTDAILRVKEWTESRTEKYVLGVFLDISGAFDNAWWPAILHRLREAGAEERLVRITKSYLVGRQAMLQTPTEEISRPLSKDCPQGSQYGPELWNLLMDSLLGLDAEEGELTVGYADDALLLSAGRSRAEVIRKAEAQLEKAGSRWGEKDPGSDRDDVSGGHDQRSMGVRGACEKGSGKGGTHVSEDSCHKVGSSWTYRADDILRCIRPAYDLRGLIVG